MGPKSRSFCKSPGDLQQSANVSRRRIAARPIVLAGVGAWEEIQRHGIGARFHRADIRQPGERSGGPSIRDKFAFRIDEQKRDARLSGEFQRDL